MSNPQFPSISPQYMPYFIKLLYVPSIVRPPGGQAQNEGNFRCGLNEWTGRPDTCGGLEVGGCDGASLTDDFADASDLVGGSIEGGDFLHCSSTDRVLEEKEENQDVNGG